MLRSELLVVAQALFERADTLLSLDQIAEAIGTLRVTSDEIEALFSWLEARGRGIGAPVDRASSVLLAEVLAAARTLRQELGRAPQPRELAERACLPLDAVQRALWFARILQR